MQAKLVSVIMPAYNCEQFIKSAIDSILNQTYSNFELLIADDCSKDRTKQIIDSYSDKRIKTFHNEVNLGYLKASNKLFALCKGEYITFQDADDYSDLTRIEKLIGFLEVNKDVGVVGSAHHKVDNGNNLFASYQYSTTHNEIIKDYENYKIAFIGSALMLRNEVLKTVGTYNLYFDRIGCEDNYWFSLIIEKFRVANLPEYLYYYRANPNSVTAHFKNPKSSVLSDFNIFLYKYRKTGKKDFIQLQQFNKSEACINFLISIKLASENKVKSFYLFFKQCIFSPLLVKYFFRNYLFRLVKT